MNGTEKDFVTVDDDLVACSMPTMEDIAEEVSTSQPDVFTSEDEDNERSSNNKRQPTTTETFIVLNELWHAVACKNIREDRCAH